MLASSSQGKKIPKQIVQLRMENMERRRVNKLNLLRDVRETIIEEQFNAMKSTTGSMMLP
jgi:hypothetical protein